MMNTPNPEEPTVDGDETPGRSRPWVKLGLALLILVGAGSAAAFYFLKQAPKSRQEVDYEKSDVGQAAAKEQAAVAQVEKDKKALKDAQAAFEAAKSDWEKAKHHLNQAQQTDRDTESGNPGQKERSAVQAARQQLADAAERMAKAKTRLEEVRDRLKTDAQRHAEAKAERERMTKLAAREQAYHDALLGKWTREDDYGRLTLELEDDGTGLMTIYFNRTKAFFLGTDTLEVDIKWKITAGNHMVSHSVTGRPKSTFDFVTKLRGSYRDQVLSRVKEDTFTTHEADNQDKVKTWTRIETE